MPLPDAFYFSMFQNSGESITGLRVSIRTGKIDPASGDISWGTETEILPSQSLANSTVVQTTEIINDAGGVGGALFAELLIEYTHGGAPNGQHFVLEMHRGRKSLSLTDGFQDVLFSRSVDTASAARKHRIYVG